MPPKITAILIARPDRFRESLQILLTSISRIDEIFLFGSLTEGLSLAEARSPFIVILDSQAAGHDLPAALAQIGNTWPAASRILLVEDNHELQQGTAQGADLLLLKGFNASTFINGIEGIFTTRYPNEIT